MRAVAMRWLSDAAMAMARRFITLDVLPRHIAIIMDGNRRYAERRRLHRQEGHRIGFDKLKELLNWMLDMGILNISVFAFSIDNFNRSDDEVDALMSLATEKFKVLLNDLDVVHKYKVKILVTGRLELLPDEVRTAAQQLMDATREYSNHVLNICFAYTGSYDIAQAVHRASSTIDSQHSASTTCREIEGSLLTAGMPAVDLLLRTSGETRLSDFLMWQSSDAHLVFIDTLWPDLSFWHLARVIFDFQVNCAELCAAPHGAGVGRGNVVKGGTIKTE